MIFFSAAIGILNMKALAQILFAIILNFCIESDITRKGHNSNMKKYVSTRILLEIPCTQGFQILFSKVVSKLVILKVSK